MKHKIRKKEVFIFGGILLLSIVAGLIYYFMQSSKDYGSIRITVGLDEFGTYSLGKNQEIDIDGHNKVTIKDGQAVMSFAECPDHLCMSMSPIDERGGLIVCLPNQVIIEGIPAESTKNNGVDALS